MTRREQTGDERLEQAMDWFLRLNEPARTNDDEKAFCLWMSASAENRAAWAKACRTWEVMGAGTVPKPSHVQSSPQIGKRPSIPLRSHRRVRGKAIGIGFAAVAACLIALVSVPGIFTHYEADYTTATAENRLINLEDGSTVELGASSAIAVEFSTGERRVRLLSGQAYFDVRQDASRPFTVETDELDVTVIGTAFDVNITPEAETVQLAHGAIQLSRAVTSDRVRMAAGDTVTLDRASGQLSRATIDVDAIASWRGRRLFVQDVPISAVVAELQRYHRSWITVASAELGNLRVTGLYDLSDPDRALEALVRPYGGKVHHVSPYLRVLARF